LHTRTFEEVGTQVELKPESCEAEVQADECWTTILDSSTLAENDRLKAENERLQVENSLLQNEWVLVHESIYEMRQRLDPLLSQLALLREENRELKRIIRRHK
jgi:predicted nuclease with TOPRIM domain